MRTRFLATVCVAAVAAFAAPALAVADADMDTPSMSGDDGHDHKDLHAIGLTKDQRLVEFEVADPSKAWGVGKVSGLSGDSKLVGIDFRVQNEMLYGVGDKGGIYTLSTKNAKAMKVSQLTIALAGSYFGVDFNPAANRLRVISDTGQNLRHNIDGATPLGTTMDGTLTNPTTPPSTAMAVTGAAYTNNDLNTATATSLFDIDTMADRVSIQSPANAGNLAPTGSLGINAGPDAGFDIYFNAKKNTNTGYATLDNGSGHRLYEVNLLTGGVRSMGGFADGGQVTDIALPLNQD
ncbi:DUF4394 domain-containing protein [Streptomyces sp. TBY4]|uniref:DUF4394 domain-containing protein n=1 Tax=Streptomyces sp. TBY4 TaxID=2962030 RepID=UPI0020B82983|nr:DUF4394 domain-containing protein [Streptomyces sp. TBY4]MCP3760741.1 DUF4394 domain-containing protein [Streptomyces sp. TBY4]